MKRQQGFTLIELVVVIIILGILAVTAAPKFINLQSDARVSALQGLKGAIQGANSLVYSKAALSGVEKLAFGASPAPTINIGTANVTTSFGYLQATKTELENGVDIKFDEGADGKATDGTAEWVIKETKPETGAKSVEIWQKGAPADCKLTYTEAENATTAPKFSALPAASAC
ncbi:MAG: type II secretion system protein [Shewanella sp.]|uniref:type II secretion system protein n=1 Tax=Shewanella sp. TaxID=50422 RepID=UPI002649773B|nr:type II secretion system protein [Shewanella sp.]MDN5499015.1 type II secretion system protein [Shewanella sp.]MDN5526940.1 type II secretion system protein [Shewanella sp.]